jgi:hypothetical protein
MLRVIRSEVHSAQANSSPGNVIPPAFARLMKNASSRARQPAIWRALWRAL